MAIEDSLGGSPQSQSNLMKWEKMYDVFSPKPMNLQKNGKTLLAVLLAENTEKRHFYISLKLYLNIKKSNKLGFVSKISKRPANYIIIELHSLPSGGDFV